MATTHDLDLVLHAIRGTGQWDKSGKMTSSGGLVSIVARRLGVSRQTVYNYKKRWKTVAEALEEESDEMLDFSQQKLFEQVAEGNMTAIIFHLKCKGKHLGYVERQEITGKDGEAIQVVSVGIDVDKL